MRVIRGKFKSKRLTVPKGFPSRPTTDFAKEGLFNILENKLDFHHLEILDLCAGTGNISVEFLSRDAKQVTAVDSNFKCIRHLRNLTKELEMEKNLLPVKMDAIKFLKQSTANYDIIFADPPFKSDFYSDIVAEVFLNNLLKQDALLIIEHGKRTDLSQLEHFDVARKYGNVVFSFFK